jgi:hypothetical protein
MTLNIFLIIAKSMNLQIETQPLPWLIGKSIVADDTP